MHTMGVFIFILSFNHFSYKRFIFSSKHEIISRLKLALTVPYTCYRHIVKPGITRYA